MLEILDNNKESNLDNANFPKSPSLSSYNLRSPYNLRSTMNINKRLPIQVLLANKWYTLKAGVWENMKESCQRILIYIQNIKGSFGELRNPLYTLYKKYSYKYRVYKKDSRPYFRGVYLRCYMGGRPCGKVYANSILLFCQLTCV